MPQPLKVFVSHHRSEEEDAVTMRLVTDLRNAGVDVWVDTERIPSGDFVGKINEGLKGRQYLILVMTPGALTSRWVQMEVNAAITQMHAGRMLGVIPLLVKPCKDDDIPPLWATLQRYDATQEYEASVRLLFRALGVQPPVKQPPAPQPAPSESQPAKAGGDNAFEKFDPTGFRDFFDVLFKGKAESTNATAKPGADLSYDLTITFEEAVRGAQKEIEITRWEACPECKSSGVQPGSATERCVDCQGTGETRRVEQSNLGQFVNVKVCERCHGEGRVFTKPCNRCHGTGRERKARRVTVNIPAGVDNGISVRVTGEGDVPIRGGTPGNLYVNLTVTPHPLLKRDGLTITLDLQVSRTLASQGGEARIPTVEGAVIMKIPPGTKDGQVLRLKGKGAPVVNGTERGDELVTVRIV